MPNTAQVLALVSALFLLSAAAVSKASAPNPDDFNEPSKFMLKGGAPEP